MLNVPKLSRIFERATFYKRRPILTVARTVIGRPASQCCQMHDNYPPKTIISKKYIQIQLKRLHLLRKLIHLKLGQLNARF